jgi:hypothetical protein
VIGLLLSPGQRLGPPRQAVFAGIPGAVYPLPGSSPQEYLYVMTYAGGSISASLRPGDPVEGFAAEAGPSFARILLRGIFPALFLGVVIVSFLTLLARGRIDLVNGAVLGAVAFAAQVPDLWAHDFSPGGRLMKLAQIGLWSLWVFALWSAGESLLRACRPGSAATLDALRARKLGPRAGRALLLGVACGAALAGLRLAVLAAAVAIPGIWPEASSLRLPIYDPWDSVVVYGLSLAGAVALVKAAAQSRLPARWAPAAAALFVGLCANPVYLRPYTAEIVANFALAAILVAFLRKTDLTALLAASLTLVLLPAAVFAGLHLSWQPWTFLTSSGIVLALLALGAAGLRQSAHVESGRVPRPAFVRRIEEERRLRYEMDLLARMQEGLLPDALPEIPGWQIAARSVLATEAGGDLYDFRFDREGRLWIAAGDVAGHGYSCAIVQAMTLAALGSFIAQGRSPAEVLQSVDPVIRRGTGSRNFTSLVLLRLDPATGEVVLSNAGHPFPLLASDGDVREIDLPGLPLGQGPSREYRDRTFYLPPGGVLVLYSDGLAEARDTHDALYGFDRPKEVLQAIAHSPADRVLDILHADWRRHLGAEEPADDTTILVLKRA